jgi:hypothetical protein
MPKPKPVPDLPPEPPEVEESKPLELQFGGHTFQIPRQAQWSTRAFIAMYAANASGRVNDWIRFIELLLGEDTFDLLCDEVAPTAESFGEFLDALIPVVVKEIG